ncbi:MAG: hypothetical protein EXQ81_01335 [Thermoleophilia bacterium]|nr:hypothetical protein [Thermoleophilia bacterium]
MTAYRYADETTPPDPVQVSDVAIMRFEHIFEVDPKLMTDHLSQQEFPNWDTIRIVAARHSHLAWMHDHWTLKVLSAGELLDDITREDAGS